MANENYLHRYTNIKYMMEILKNKKLTLVSPVKWRNQSWVDRNDMKCLEMYEKRIGKNIYVICFTKEQESNFYWDSFGGGIDCRISFDREKLIKEIKSTKGIHFGDIVYKKINVLKKEMEANEITLGSIPFIKRWPYHKEEEYRIIWEGKKQDNDLKQIKISLDSIISITLSDKYTKEKADSYKNEIKSIKGLNLVSVTRGTIHEYDRWLKYMRDGIKNI